MFDVTSEMEAQRMLAARDRILDAVALASQVLLRSSDWREAVEGVLGALGAATRVAHVSVWENIRGRDDLPRERLSFEWSAPGHGPSDPLGTEVDLDGSWKDWTEAMRNGKSISGHSHDRPAEERSWFDEHGMTSILDVPVTVDEGVVTPPFRLLAASGEIEVAMTGYSFQPGTLVVTAGTTVTWINNDGQVRHDVASDTGLFQSELFNGDDSFSYTFDQPGVYPYYCHPHGGPGGDGMAGTIVVLAAG